MHHSILFELTLFSTGTCGDDQLKPTAGRVLEAVTRRDDDESAEVTPKAVAAVLMKRFDEDVMHEKAMAARCRSTSLFNCSSHCPSKCSV